ncbi:MAG: glycosyltransferase [Pseudomonadota bacterium]
MNVHDTTLALPAPAPRPGLRERPPLGRLLREHQAVSPDNLRAALSAQRETPYRLGNVLTAHGYSSDHAVAAALAEQRGIGFVDLVAAPPDPALFRQEDVDAYLAGSILPWKRLGRVTTYAVSDPTNLARALAGLSDRPDMVCVVVATRAQIEQVVAEAAREPLAERAANRTPSELSVRGIRGLRTRGALALALLAGLVIAGGNTVLALALGGLFLLNAATMVLRIAALVASRVRPDTDPPARAGIVRLNERRPLPRISLLVPLYREAAMVPGLIEALSALDYPRERLEVRLLVEADDEATARALSAQPLPAWVRPMTVPAGRPRTKPRALNYALDFCEGEIVGILDAEDRPNPGQLRAVAASLTSAPPDVAACQCQLSYYNARDNWLSRCFQLEYAIWFEVLLRGWQALGLPIPLGGTSVYFRRSVLKATGGWDAHNVTEDADLGMRLARLGLRCQVLRSTTEEEAACEFHRWIRQRSRWLKGYLLTWASHMRAPITLWREMGARGFFGLNILFLGGAAAYLAIPLFWAAVLGWVVTGEGLWQSTLPGWVIYPAGITLGLGQGVMLACACLAMLRRGTLGFIWCVPTLPFYWTLGAVAAWKAIIEIVVAPFWWDKTKHGTSPTQRRERRARRLAQE